MLAYLFAIMVLTPIFPITWVEPAYRKYAIRRASLKGRMFLVAGRAGGLGVGLLGAVLATLAAQTMGYEKLPWFTDFLLVCAGYFVGDLQGVKRMRRLTRFEELVPEERGKTPDFVGG